MGLRHTFPLTYRFRATTPARAFLLAAFIQAIVAVLAIEVDRGLHDKTSRTYRTFKGLLLRHKHPWTKTGITFVSAFLAALMVMNVMWALVAYGGSMLVGKRPGAIKTWI